MAAPAPALPNLAPGRVGGVVGAAGTAQVRFSGGGIHAANRRTTPYSVSCYRPDHTNLRTLQTITDAAKKPLPEASRLHLDPSKSGATFTAWMDDVHRHCLGHGLDSCFYVLKRTAAAITAATPLALNDVANTTEHYLVKQWGQVIEPDILAFDALMRVLPCDLDVDNDMNCCEFLRGSVCLEMKRILDQELPIETSAAFMLWTIIQKVQGVNSTAGRLLFKQIEVLRLSKEAAYDVDKFCLKLHTLCATLSGLGKAHIPADFSVIIAACFDTTGIQQFDLEMATLSNELDYDMSKYSWDAILQQARTKFTTMKNTNRWPPLVGGSSKAAEYGFTVKLKSLETKISKLESAKPPDSSVSG